jgi:hypothetical protein
MKNFIIHGISFFIPISVDVKTDEPDWGSYKEFVEALKKTFQPYNELAEALEDMKKLRLGDGSITEHNSKFCLLVSQTGMKDSPGLTDLYRETLPWGLQGPIIRSEHPPKTLEEWYTKATNFYVKRRNTFLGNEITSQQLVHHLHKSDSPSLKRRTPTPWTSTGCQSKNERAS